MSMSVSLGDLITATTALRVNSPRQIFGTGSDGNGGLCAYRVLQHALPNQTVVRDFLLAAADHGVPRVVEMNDVRRLTFDAMADWYWSALVEVAEVEMPETVAAVAEIPVMA